MNKYLILFFMCLATQIYAQNPTKGFETDFIAQRKIFNTIVLKGGVKQTKQATLNAFKSENANVSISKYKKSNRFLMASPVVGLAGGYLAYKNLKGTPKIYYDATSGKAYPYKTRSIKKVVLGLGLFATGVCLMEMSNDLKVKSIKLYQQKKLERAGTTPQTLNFGITPSERIGFCFNL